MAENFDPAAVEGAFKSMLGVISQESSHHMRNFAGHQQARAKQQSALADRLAAKLGEKHARVQALRRSGESSGRLAEQLGRAISRIETASAARPGSVLFSGRVTDAAGTAVVRASVRLSDRAGKLHVAGSAVTDERGEFTLAVAPDAFDPKATDLILVVEDAEQRIAGMSPNPVRLEPNVWQRVDLTAAAPPRKVEETGGKPRRARAGRRPPRPPTK